MRDTLTASVLTLTGFCFLALATYPFLVWQFFYLPKIESQKLLSPFINSSAWGFETRESKRPSIERMSQFFISVPKLGIEDAKVKAESNDFFSSLAHYPESALPGEQGNVFVVGHSVLPYFFNPRSYFSIFSTLHTLERGDEIMVSLEDSTRYRYQVIGMVIVDPKDTWVLKTPERDGKYLSLLTCSPPGLSTDRLVVIAKQV